MSYHPVNFDDHRHCGRGNIKALVFYVILPDHAKKGSCDLNTISFLSFKQMLDAVLALDGKPIYFKVFQSSLGLFVFCLR